MARKLRTANTARKLEDTSWLAQIIQDKMDVESDAKGYTIRYDCLQILHIIVNEADDTENSSITYEQINGKRGIVIRQIPSLTIKRGTDFDTYGMQCKLRGLAANYKYDNGDYLVNVLTTNDLNSATIEDVSELMYQIGQH